MKYIDMTAGESVAAEKFYGYCNAATNITSGYTDIPIDNEDVKTSGFTHSTSSSPAEVTINNDGYYLILFRMTGETQNNSDALIETKMQVDTGSGFADETGAYARGSITQNNGWSQTIPITLIKQLSAGDKIKFQGNLASGNTVYLLSDASSLSIMEIK